ncbi:MAG TPA: ADP-ribosylglycohydrolase family protein, partial [Acidimicrobiales bacterium]|nr:ADP-ribosylglycohydrolase family protein [Acidimicrobiales bacterium]
MRLTQQAAIEHRIAGALLGVAAGDALGATVEFASPEQIARRFPAGHREIVGGGPFGWRPGQGTDDTDLTMALVRAYLAPEGFSLERAAEEFLAWFDAGPRDVGGTTAAALAAYRRDRDLATCGQRHERSAANGSLMRCIATGLVRADAGLRRREAAAISRITHAERRCVESCVAYCDLVSALLDGMPPRSAVAWVAEHAPVSDDVRAVIADAPAAAIDTLPTTGYVFDALRAAVWALCQPTAPEDTLVAVVARGGDADTVGAVVGGLLGAAHGADGLPARWVQRLEYAPEIAAAVPRLAALRTGATPHRRLWRLDAARPAPAPRPARQLPGRLVTVDCDGTLFDSWACCGKRAASWEGDPGCAHLRGDVLDDARRLAAAHDAGLAVLSWRPGADAVTRRWLARVGLDEE